MYSTSIRNNRYQVQCIIVLDKIRTVKFIVDTGCKYLPAVINLILCFLYFFQNDVVRIPKKGL